MDPQMYPKRLNTIAKNDCMSSRVLAKRPPFNMFLPIPPPPTGGSQVSPTERSHAAKVQAGTLSHGIVVVVMGTL